MSHDTLQRLKANVIYEVETKQGLNMLTDNKHWKN